MEQKSRCPERRSTARNNQECRHRKKTANLSAFLVFSLVDEYVCDSARIFVCVTMSDSLAHEHNLSLAHIVPYMFAPFHPFLSFCLWLFCYISLDTHPHPIYTSALCQRLPFPLTCPTPTHIYRINCRIIVQQRHDHLKVAFFRSIVQR